MSIPLRVAAASIGPADGDLSAALAEAGRQIAHLAGLGAELIVLPELFALPYVAGDDPANWRHLAEPLYGPTARWARGEAVRHGVDIVFGMALDEGLGKPLNAAVLARRDGSLTRVAAKMNLPPPAPGEAFGEADHFTAGEAAVASFELASVRVAVLICYDRRFPECWRAARQSGADLVLVLVGGPAPQDPDGIYLAEIRTHARANAVYALAAARSGTEAVLGRPVRHDGTTVAVEPYGAVLTKGPGRADDVVIIDLDPSLIAATRASGARIGRPVHGSK